MPQSKLPGWDEIEGKWAAENLVAKKIAHEENAASILRSIVEHYPASAEEWEIMACGIRLCRFVSELECEKCNLDTEDHTVGWQFLTKVCLKDYYALLKKLGLRK